MIPPRGRPVLADDTAGKVPAPVGAGEDTDLAVSVVLFDPTVELLLGIFAAFGGVVGAYTLAAFDVAEVAGAAGGGAEMTEPCA
jgi:hypothetical protein